MDRALVVAALDQMKDTGRLIPGASPRSVEAWRGKLRRGAAIHLKGSTREALRRYLAGESGIESVDYWRGVASTAERMARALADMLAEQLAGGATPASDAAGAAVAGAAQRRQEAAGEAPSRPRGRRAVAR